MSGKGTNAAAKEFVPSWMRNSTPAPQEPAQTPPPQSQQLPPQPSYQQGQQQQASGSPSKNLSVAASEWRPGLTGGPEAQHGHGNGGGAPPAHDSQGNLIFYDTGRMIRPGDQPHFFTPDAAPPLPTVQVGRVGSMPSAHQRAGIMPMTAPMSGTPARNAAAAASPNGYTPYNPATSTPPPQQSGVSTLAQDPNSPGVMPATSEEASIFTTLSRLQRPLIVLVVGGRGSGKSTQSRAIAIKYGLLHLCSGDIVRNGQQPLETLEDVLKYLETELAAERAQRKAARDDRDRQGAASSKTTTPPPEGGEEGSALSTPSKKHEYATARRGIVLDRYLNNAEADPLFLLELLHRYGLQLDLVVNLMMSYEASVARAEERDAEAAAAAAADEGDSKELKEKPKKDQRRLLEHLTVFNSCTHVFQPYGGLACLDVEGMSIEEVEHQINLRVDRAIIGIRAQAAGAKRSMLPPPTMCPGVTMNVVHNDFHEARKDLHDVLGTPATKYGMSPASLMTGLVHAETMKRLRWYLKDYHVSWKADGTRVIIARHLKFGFIAFTGKFSSFYVIDPKLVPSHWNDLPTGFEGNHDEADSDDEGDDDSDKKKAATALGDRKLTNVTHIFDAELVENHHGKWKMYVFDVLYAVSTVSRASGTPLLGSKTQWKERYNYLQALCSGLNDANAWTFLCLKKFVWCGDIRSLVAAPPSFPTDGIVFQHPDPYRVPTDNRLYKWKPRDQCSADFRLSNGLELPAAQKWLFFPLVLRLVNGTADESGFKNSIVDIPTSVVEKADLSDGAVVECLKTDRTVQHEGFEYEVWEYLRPRPDKVYPNYDHIAKQIDEMGHLTQPEVVDFCEQYCDTASTPAKDKSNSKHDAASGRTSGGAAERTGAPAQRRAPAGVGTADDKKPQAWRPASSSGAAADGPPSTGNAWARDLRNVMGTAGPTSTSAADDAATDRHGRENRHSSGGGRGGTRGGYDGEGSRGGRGSGERGGRGSGGDRGGRGRGSERGRGSGSERGGRGGERGRGGGGRARGA